MEAWWALNDKTQSVLIQIKIKNTNFSLSSDSCGKSHMRQFLPFLREFTGISSILLLHIYIRMV